MAQQPQMTNCAACGNPIARNAKSCPNCGAKIKKPIYKRWWFIALIVIVVLWLIGSMGNDEPTVQKVDNPSNSSSESQSSAPAPAPTVFTKGDIVSIGDIQVQLLDAYETTGSQFFTPSAGNTFVIFEFEILNNSNESLSISSLLCFEAYFDDYATDISLIATSSQSPKKSVDGTVAPGKKLSGITGYEVPSDWKKSEVTFTPSAFGNDSATFVYEKTE